MKTFIFYFKYDKHKEIYILQHHSKADESERRKENLEAAKENNFFYVQKILNMINIGFFLSEVTNAGRERKDIGKDCEPRVCFL